MMTAEGEGSDRPVGHSAGLPRSDFRVARAFGGDPQVVKARADPSTTSPTCRSGTDLDEAIAAGIGVSG